MFLQQHVKLLGAFSSVCQILSKIMLTKNAFVELAQSVIVWCLKPGEQCSAI